MISVLHFSNTHTRGGVEEHVLTLLAGLDRALFRLHLVCTPAVADQIRADLPADVELLTLALNRPSQLRAALKFARILRERHIDILHSHMFQSSVLATPIGKLCRVPVIVEQPHLREQWRHGWLKGRFFVDRWVGRMVDHYIAVSAANADYLVNVKHLPRQKITVVYPISNLSRFDAAAPPPLELKRSFGFADEDPVLAVVGRLEPQKGHRVLLDAMPSILREFPAARLVIVGEGRLRPDLEARIQELGLKPSVRFAGFQADVRPWLALADVTVLPSFFEGLPLSATESLAAGRPMVATAVDGTPEVILNGRTGLTVPPGDPEALAAAICHLLRNPELRRTMGQNGRQLVLENFGEQRLVQRTQEFYLHAWEQRLARGARRTASRTVSRPMAGRT